MMQDGVAPDPVKALVCEGKSFTVGDQEIDVSAIRLRPAAGFEDISRGQVERTDASAAASQDCRSHPVPAAEVEDSQSGKVSERLEGRANPRFVIEVILVMEKKPTGIKLKGQGALAGLGIVKSLLAVEAIRRAHDVSLPPSRKRR
jgi:hypothetical protein